MDTMPENWMTIPDFEYYQISDLGRVYNARFDHYMQTSETTFGHIKITLKSFADGRRHTRSVARMVAEAFVEPPNRFCDHVVVLDGDFSHIAAENLVWRPRWYAWKYTRQLKVPQPIHYHNLRIKNIMTGAIYNSVIEAGMTEGLLFDHIWQSTYRRAGIYPHGAMFEVIQP